MNRMGKTKAKSITCISRYGKNSTWLCFYKDTKRYEPPISYYKNEYEGIVSQYKEVIRALDVEISNLNKTIDNFNKVESLKGGM